MGAERLLVSNQQHTRLAIIGSAYTVTDEKCVSVGNDKMIKVQERHSESASEQSIDHDVFNNLCAQNRTALAVFCALPWYLSPPAYIIQTNNKCADLCARKAITTRSFTVRRLFEHQKRQCLNVNRKAPAALLP